MGIDQEVKEESSRLRLRQVRVSVEEEEEWLNEISNEVDVVSNGGDSSRLSGNVILILVEQVTRNAIYHSIPSLLPPYLFVVAHHIHHLVPSPFVSVLEESNPWVPSE